MTRIIYNYEFSRRPDSLEIECPSDWSLEIKSSTNQYARDLRDEVCVAEHNAIIEPRIVSNVMGHDAREGESKGGIVKSGRQAVRRRPRRGRGLPRAPREGSLVANRGVRTAEQIAI